MSSDDTTPFTEAWYNAHLSRQFWLLRGLSRLLIVMVRGYQVTLRAVMGRQCRFTPTCSDYAIHAIKRYGPFVGFVKATWRILRCNPWGGCGWDPA